MRYFYTFLLLLTYSNSSLTQDCYPDFNHASGGMFPFRTYRQSQSPYEPLEGICSQSQNGIVHSYFEFKDGQIMVHRAYDPETGKLTNEFKRVTKDSIIAESFTKPDGIHLEEKKTYYLNKQGKRCWKEEKYLEGKLSQVSYYRNFTVEELANSGNCYSTKHESDSAGYSNQYALFGKETIYHPNGKVMSVTEHQLIISDRSYDYHGRTQHGKYFQYAENGVEIERGTYTDGRQNGEFIYHHPNGKLAAKKYFGNGIPTGHWIEYYDDGKLMSTTDYGDQYYEDTGHEKRYFRSGRLQYESMMKKDTLGFTHEFYENGSMKERTIYRLGPGERTAYFKYFPNGALEQKTYLRAQNDTSSVEFYPDGFLKSISMHFKENDRQETRSYFANHKPEREETIERIGEITHHLYNQYSENGKKHIQWETHGKYFNSKEYWSNGRLKFHKQFERVGNENLLNGYWIEQDSLGKTIKKCSYKNGYRVGHCEVLPAQKGAKLSKEQEALLRPLTIQSITRTKYEKNCIVDEAMIVKQTQVLKLATEYMMSEVPTYQLPAEQNLPANFCYWLYNTDGSYVKNKNQIDSILALLNWEIVQPVVTHGQEGSGRFASSKLYSPLALDSIFGQIFPNAGSFLWLENSVYIGPMEYYPGYVSPVSIERKETENAWVVNLYNTKVVVYEDGTAELYNGNKLPERPISATAVGAYEWTITPVGVVKGKGK